MSANNWAKWGEFKAKLSGSSASTEETSSDYGLATVSAESGINVREGAGTNYDKIGALAYGTEVRIGSVQNNWANIYFGNHGGWVCLDYLNVYKVFKKPTPTPPPSTSSGNTYYRVVVGSYKERSNAEDIQSKLKSNGFDAFLVAFEKDGVNYLRVVAGSYKEKTNAIDTQNKLKAKGFDSFLVAFTK